MLNQSFPMDPSHSPFPEVSSFDNNYIVIIVEGVDYEHRTDIYLCCNNISLIPVLLELLYL